MNVMPKLIPLLLAGLLASLPGKHLSAQSLPGQPASTILDSYIRQGLDSNLALHQRNFDLGRAQLDLQRARTLFYPQAGFSSQYTIANGGRTQDIPIGDLLNGVYSSLNQLTGSNKFPQVANQSIQFLPNDYHDTKLEISLPLVNTDLQHNREVNSEMINARRADRDVYRRDLVLHIRQAYYQFLQADRATAIYQAALLLVKENRRVSEKFVENRMATKEIVLRAQAQVSQVESSLIAAENNLHNAAAYFNFLLNQPLDNSIATDSTLMTDETAVGASVAAGVPVTAGASVANAPASTRTPDAVGYPEFPSGREELHRIRSAQRILQSNLKWDQAYLIPRLNAFYDIGFQGYGFKFNNTQFYQLAGIQLQWPLFKANDNKYKIRQAHLDVTAMDEQYRELTQQLTLQTRTTTNNYYSARHALQSLSDEVSSARETYRLAERRFREGQALQIELIDARTQLTNAELRYSLGRLDVLNRTADLERVTASYKF